MVAITLFFVLGGIAATLMRLELATPVGDLVNSETYNKLFTFQGVVMVWFFLIPSIPNVLGNFLLPMMPLLVTLLFVETADIIFAMDSIPACCFSSASSSAPNISSQFRSGCRCWSSSSRSALRF